MRTVTAAFTALALAAALAAPGAAQEAGARRAAAALAPDTTYEFGDDEVDGSRRSAMGERVVGRARGSRRSLVRPRLHFVPEMLKSVEDM